MVTSLQGLLESGNDCDVKMCWFFFFSYALHWSHPPIAHFIYVPLFISVSHVSFQLPCLSIPLSHFSSFTLCFICHNNYQRGVEWFFSVPPSNFKNTLIKRSETITQFSSLLIDGFCKTFLNELVYLEWLFEWKWHTMCAMKRSTSVCVFELACYIF